MPKKYRLSGEELRKLSSPSNERAGRLASRAGKRFHGRLFSLLLVPIAGSSAKCACVVSKKSARKAVERNTIKRRCRSILSKRMPSVKTPLALLFYAKPGARDATFSEVERDIESLLARL
ncbi:MAG TPA: ribonuclease P protein component [Candidatus Paceibacterota bacterium]|nr:ribonuclease P protein component [Candidatus Paceibacterota bacterium]